MRKIEKMEDKEDESRGREVLYKLCLVSSKFIKKYSIVCTVCRGGRGETLSRTVLTKRSWKT